MRTRDCDSHARRGRLRKAEEFLASAETLGRDDDSGASADSRVSLYVLAGIAAADVICCLELRRYAVGDDHAQALTLLRQADTGSTSHLARLLKMKTKAAYTEIAASAAELKSAERAATELLERARVLSAGRD